MVNCPYCTAVRPTISAIHRHQGQSPQCLQARRLYQRHLLAQQRAAQPLITESHTESHIGTQQPLADAAGTSVVPDENPGPMPMMDIDSELPMEAEEPISDEDAQRPRVSMEDVTDNDEDAEWVHKFPEQWSAGAAHKSSHTLFESICDDQVLRGAEVLGPFENDEEWQLAKWLIKNVGHNQAEHFLKLPIVSSHVRFQSIYPDLRLCSKIQNRVDPSFATKDILMDTIDELPHGVDWTYRPVTLHGDLLNDAGEQRTEQLELWYREPVGIVRELMGNPMFRDVMRYSPEKIYRDEEGKERIVNEMWTADWWWKMQVR